MGGMLTPRRPPPRSGHPMGFDFCLLVTPEDQHKGAINSSVSFDPGMFAKSIFDWHGVVPPSGLMHADQTIEEGDEEEAAEMDTR